MPINVSEFTLIAERESVKSYTKHSISICLTFSDKNSFYLHYLWSDLYSLWKIFTKISNFFPGSVAGIYFCKQPREFCLHKWWGWRGSWGWWWHGGGDSRAPESSLRPHILEHHRDDQLHLRRRDPLRRVGEMAVPWRLLLLFHHAHNNRVWRHGSRRLGQSW